MSSEDLVKLRHHIHSIAEVSGEEKETAAFIEKQLKKLNTDEIISELGGHGVLARFNGKQEGPVILIRCELDALPIEEENDFEYLSRNKNTGHKCGHDGHMTILLGVAKQLSKKGLPKGDVLLLFQPAEETGQGAEKVLEDEKFNKINPDYVFALHNVPGFEKGNVIVKSGPFAAASVGFIVRFKGKTAHAAHPEQGKSPAPAVAQMIQSLSSLPQYYAPLEKAAKATVVQAHLGERAFGTSPGEGEVMATLRTFDDELLKIMKTKALDLAKGIAATYDLELQTEWVESFAATVNDNRAVDIIRSAASLCDIEVTEKEEPFSWSEDFGHFTSGYTGALFGLGSGTDQPALHAADYDFPDDIIPAGIAMFMGIINEIYENNKT